MGGRSKAPRADSNKAQPVWAWTGPVLAASAAVVPYLATLTYGFVFDDIDAVVENPLLRGWGAIPRIFALWRRALVNYRPVRFLSLAIDYNLGGGAPWVFHATNVLLHAACAVLLGLLIQRTSRRRLLAWMAAVLFAVLPAHAAAVAYVSARKDLLATGFYLLALLALIAYRERGRWFWALATFGAGGLAALSKETAATLPLALLLLDGWLHAQASGEPLWLGLKGIVRRRRPYYLAWALLLCVYVVYKLVIWPATNVPREQWGHVWLHTGTALHVWAVALAQMILPWRTIPGRMGMIELGSGWMDLSWVGLAATIALLLGAWRLRRARPVFGLGITFLLLSWLPTAGIIPIAEVFAERYLYLPSCGLCVAAAALAAPWLDARMDGVRSLRNAMVRPAALGATAMVLALAFWSAYLTRTWANEKTVWEASARANPKSYRAAVNLSAVYMREGRAAEAVAQARRALQLNPTMPVVTAQLMASLVQNGQAQVAVDLGGPALRRSPNSPELVEAMAVALIHAQQPAQAEPLLERLTRQSPSAYLLGLLGQTLIQLGRAAQADSILTRAIAADSTYSEAWTNLGLAQWRLGRADAAERAFRRAIALAPADPDPHNNLAVLLFESGRVQEAARHAKLSADLGRPLHPDFEKALMAALKAQGATSPDSTRAPNTRRP